MALPLEPPIPPQLARHAAEMPHGDAWVYEPKWDGFRALAFVEEGRARLVSRSGKQMARYFPELAFPDGTYALDGELVMLDAQGREDFDALQMRLHPADSRIEKLSRERPTAYIAFDLLAEGGRDLTARPLAERRAALERIAVKPLALTPQTDDPELAETWLEKSEGVVAKRLDSRYSPGRGDAWLKVKRRRTADCVVIGWREGKGRTEGDVGSLILGLYDEAGELHHVGHVGSLSAAQREGLVERLRELETGELSAPEASRWDAGRERSWRVLRPELVVEVSFDQASKRRIRHGARFARWRTDREPAGCSLEQLAPPV